MAHKEKIKKLKENVDVLTLTATPIPRTLHMSLAGIRDMSVLEEPPVDRVPIQTYVMEYNDEMVREAIHREMARGGQVYYVYNRVQNIDEVAAHVAQLAPEATVVYAHGQMRGAPAGTDHVRFCQRRYRCAGVYHHYRNRFGHSQRQYHDYPRRRPHGGCPQLYQLRGTGGALQPDGLRVSDVQAGTRC